MMKHLTKLALAGTLGVFLLAGDAEACCHMNKNKCTSRCAAPVVCAPAPVVYAQPAPCPRPVKTACCAPRQKKCGGGGLFAGLCHKKKSCAPAPAPCTTVVYNYAPTYNYGAPMASGQYPMGTPQVPGKSMGTPQR